jgi:diguanylate cyclase (GGDEF) domain
LPYFVADFALAIVYTDSQENTLMDLFLTNWVADDLLAILVSLCLLISVYTSDGVIGKIKLDFVHMVFMALIAMIMDLHIALLGETYFFNIVSFLVTPFIPVLGAKVFYKSAKQTWFLAGPAVLNGILVLLTPFTGYIFSITEGVYERGPAYAVFVFSCVWAVVLLFYKIVGLKKRYNDIPGSFLYAAILFIVCGIGMRIVFPDIHSNWLIIALAMIFGELMLQSFLSAYDPLTGVRSRKTFESALLSANGLILFDIDDFKVSNDNNGHSYGDEVLRTIAGLIDEVFRFVGVCYRVGGDEFCVLLFDGEKPVKQIAEFEARVRTRHELDSRFPFVSLGYEAKKPGTNNRFGTLFEIADKNLYREKQRNKELRKAESR